MRLLCVTPCPAQSLSLASVEKKWCLAEIFPTEGLGGFQIFPSPPTVIPGCNMAHVQYGVLGFNKSTLGMIFFAYPSPHELLGG